MKKDKHPAYQKVIFRDSSTGKERLIGTTLQPEETATYEGKEYPLYKVATSSASHPFFTGSEKFVDSEGRVDKFRKRYSRSTTTKKSEDE